MTRLPLLHALVVMGLMAGVACSPGPDDGSGHAKKDRAIFVHLVEEGGRCTPHMGEVPVHVYLGDDVVWDIENDCANEAEVEFVDFKQKKSGERKDPFPEGPKKERVGKKEPGNPRANKKQLRAALRDDESYIGTYKYTARVTGGAELDPELEVDGKKSHR